MRSSGLKFWRNAWSDSDMVSNQRDHAPRWGQLSSTFFEDQSGALMATISAAAHAGSGLNERRYRRGANVWLCIVSQVRALRDAEQRARSVPAEPGEGNSHLSLGQKPLPAGFAEAMVKGDLVVLHLSRLRLYFARGVPVEKVPVNPMQKE